ncbi:hypothetical protein M5Y49_18800 [Escherichia coli]|uniref:T6SS immunity periplasmic lipoprotein n=1 Tax=Phytobacter palmae TaxID=1855371 RepID=A0ABU9VAH3_9ENTR|nr:hypothetical protein [Escherichia coli]
MVLRRGITRGILLLASLVALTGCPGSGDRLRADETTSVRRTANNDVCFAVHNAQDYQPVFISINPRAIPPPKQKYTLMPPLTVKDAQLCIPPSFYTFTGNGQFIVKYILKSRTQSLPARSVVVGVEALKGEIYAFPLANNEITR